MAETQLETSRLFLRPFRLADASDVQRMAGDPDVAATTLSIPHPYLDGMAEEWISQHEKWRTGGWTWPFALEEKASGKLIGCVSVEIEKNHHRGVLGYWMGKEYWNKGFCSEATRRLVEFAFRDLELNRVYAYHLASNLPSGKVMQKAGMKQEGYFKNHVLKNGTPRDSIFYGLTRENFLSN